MDRRRFLLTSLAGALAAPLAIEAQRVEKVYRIGYLAGTQLPPPGAPPPTWEAFLLRLRELGYVEGRNITIEKRFSDGNVERLLPLAAELVRLKPDVIVALGTPATVAVRRETTTIPIVMAGGVDPVEAGLVVSLARPGGNVTGFLQDVGQQTLVKALEMLKEILPNSSRVTALVGPHQVNIDAVSLLTPIAAQLGFALRAVSVAGLREIEEAFAAIARDRPDAVFVLASHPVIVHRRLVVDLAARNRIPTAYWWSEMVRLGVVSCRTAWTGRMCIEVLPATSVGYSRAQSPPISLSSNPRDLRFSST